MSVILSIIADYYTTEPSPELTWNLWRISFPTKNDGSLKTVSVSEYGWVAIKSVSSLMTTLSGRCFPCCDSGILIFWLSTSFLIFICTCIRAVFCLFLEAVTSSHSISWRAPFNLSTVVIRCLWESFSRCFVSHSSPFMTPSHILLPQLLTLPHDTSSLHHRGSSSQGKRNAFLFVGAPGTTYFSSLQPILIWSSGASWQLPW